MAEVNSLLAETMKVYGSTMYDQVFNSSPFFAWLQKAGQTQAAPGVFIDERISITKNSTVAFRDPKAQVTASEQDPFRVMQWTFKAVDGVVPLYTFDVERNSGPGQVGNLVKDLIQNLQDSMTEHISTGCYASGGTTALDGLEAIVATGNTYGSLQDTSGGVTGADRTGATCSGWWRANVEDTSGALAVGSGSTSMWRMYDTCSSGTVGAHPDLILCTEALFEKYMATLTANQRYVNTDMADLGFQNVAFRKATVMPDQFCPSETMYFLCSKFLKLRPTPSCVGKIIQTDAHQMIDYLAKVVLVAWYGNLTCTSPRNMGKLLYKY